MKAKKIARLGTVLVNQDGEISFDLSEKAWKEAQSVYGDLPEFPDSQPCEIIINDKRCKADFMFPKSWLK